MCPDFETEVVSVVGGRIWTRGATTIVTADGKVHEGLVLSETGEKLELLSRQAERIEFNKSSIEQRKLQDLSPMPAALVRKPDELRDILSYLLQLD